MADPIIRARDKNNNIIEIYAYKGDDGRGITNALINASGELVLEFSDGTSSNLGVVVGDGSGPGTGKDGVGIKSIEQTTISTDDDGDNVITIVLTDNTSYTFTVQNGSKGSKGNKGQDIVGITYNSTTKKWDISYDDNGTTSSTSIDGPIVPGSVTDLSDGSNYYTSEEIDTMFGVYIDEVAALIGGNA